MGRLRKACSLLRQRMGEELTAGEWALMLVSSRDGKGWAQGGHQDRHAPGLYSLTLAQTQWTGCRSTTACSPWRGCRPLQGSVSTGYRNCVQVRPQPCAHPHLC